MFSLLPRLVVLFVKEQEEEEALLYEVAVEVEVENAHPPFSHSPWELSCPLSQQQC